MAASEEDDDIEELKLTVKSSKKILTKSSDDDDLTSSEESEFSESRTSGAVNENVLQGKPEEISLESNIGNIMRLQKQTQNLQRQLDREKSNRATTENKRISLENDNKLLNQKIETINKDKRSLEQLKIELEAKLRNLQLNLTEEHERRKNAEMMANRSKEQLARNDEQCKGEIAAKEKCEVMIRSLQVQLQNANASLVQMEKEKNEFQQKAFESQSALIVAQSPREGRRRKDDLQSQLALEKERIEASEKVESLAEENKRLQRSLNEMKNDLKLDEDTLAKTTLQYNIELGDLKKENARLKNSVEELEKNSLNLETIRSTLSRTTSDLERAEKKKAELERTHQDEMQMLKDFLKLRDEEMIKVKGGHETESKKLKDIELMLANSDRELEVINHSLQEKTKELSRVLEELKKQQLSHEKLEELNKQQKEENIRQQVKLESLQEKINRLQDEASKLNKNLEDEKQKVKRSEEVNSVIAGRKNDQEKALHEIQGKNDALNEKVQEFKDKLELTEHLKEALEKDLEVTREKLAETQQQILAKKMALDVDDQVKGDLKSERDQLMKKVERLGQDLDEAKLMLSDSEKRVFDLSTQLQKSEKDLADSNKALKTKQEELLFAMHQLEQNNAKLKDVVNEEQLANNQDKGRVLFGENPNVTDFDKSGSRQRKSVDGNQSDVLLSSDETTSGGRRGKHRKRLEFDLNSKTEGRLRSGSDSDVRNIAMEKEIAKLKAQLKMAKKQLQAIDTNGRYQPEGLQWQMGYNDPMQHLQKHSDLLPSGINSFGFGDPLAEIEARIRMDLNAKLAAINQYLQEHADTCEKIDIMRDRSTRVIRNEFNSLEKELQDELKKLKETQAVSKRDMKEVDEETLRLADLYSSEVPLAHHKATNINVKSAATNTVSQPEYDAGNISAGFSIGRQNMCTACPLRVSLSGLPFSIKQQLERSIAKHLEKAPQLNISSIHQDHGFAVAAMMDRSAHDYASLLKRNYLIT